TAVVFHSTLASRSSLLLISLMFFFNQYGSPPTLHSFPTRRSSDLIRHQRVTTPFGDEGFWRPDKEVRQQALDDATLLAIERLLRSEEHTSELQSLRHLVCRLLLEKKKKTRVQTSYRF